MRERFALSFLCFINTLMLDFKSLKVYNLMKKDGALWKKKESINQAI
jgi:hypothetical protein